MFQGFDVPARYIELDSKCATGENKKLLNENTIIQFKLNFIRFTMG